MKLGFVSSILKEHTFEEVIDFAADHGFQCVELASWPGGQAERRYAGVTHLDAEDFHEEQAAYIRSYCKKRQVTISALAYYSNPLDENLEKRERVIRHLEILILAAERLHIGMITTFIGRMQTKTISGNMEEVQQVWTPLLELAKQHRVKIAIENCPMLFTEDEWPGGQNLAVSPAVWRDLFERLNSPYLGLNYDPSHMIWQQMDPISPVYEFRNKLFHVHMKDIKICRRKLDEVGILAPPLSYMAPKLPGLGDMDWGKFVSALTDIGYDGPACLEIEDKSFESDRKSVEQAVLWSRHYMSQFTGG